MTKSEIKDRDRLLLSVGFGLAVHLVLFSSLSLMDLSDMKSTTHSRTVIVELAETAVTETPVQKVKPVQEEKPVEEKVPEIVEKTPPLPKETKEAAAEPETVPQVVSKTAVRPEPKPVVKEPAKPARKPAPVPAPVKKNPVPAVEKKAPTPAAVKAPAVAPEAAPARIVPDPSAAVPSEKIPPPASVGPKQVTPPPSVPKPDVKLPAWVNQPESGAIPAASAERETDAGQTAAAEAPLIDLSGLDKALASRNSASDQPEQIVMAPAAPAKPQQPAKSPVAIDWKDTKEGRDILWQEQPVMPSWVEEQGLHLAVVVSLSVLPEGTVNRVDIVKTSGYTEIDSIVAEAVRRWRFLPVQSEQVANGSLTWDIVPGVR